MSDLNTDHTLPPPIDLKALASRLAAAFDARPEDERAAEDAAVEVEIALLENVR
jgi:hypothetical protein